MEPGVLGSIVHGERPVHVLGHSGDVVVIVQHQCGHRFEGPLLW